MKKQHFSLVELLTVIAVIAILAGILIPTVGAVKESGRATQALTEAKGIHLAITSFYNDHKYLPSKDAEGGTIPGDKTCGTANDIVYWGTEETEKTDTGSDAIIKESAVLKKSYLALFDRICYVDRSDAKKVATDDAKTFNKTLTKINVIYKR